jgi:hypothetical protein
MRTFEMAQNTSIAFWVGFSYQTNLEPHMHIFEMAQNAGIAFRVGFFQSDFASAYCV